MTEFGTSPERDSSDDEIPQAVYEAVARVEVRPLHGVRPDLTILDDIAEVDNEAPAVSIDPPAAVILPASTWDLRFELDYLLRAERKLEELREQLREEERNVQKRRDSVGEVFERFIATEGYGKVFENQTFLISNGGKTFQVRIYTRAEMIDGDYKKVWRVYQTEVDVI